MRHSALLAFCILIAAASPAVAAEDPISTGDLDIFYRNGLLWRKALDVAVYGNTLYCAQPYGISVYDIADPAEPSLVTRLSGPGIWDETSDLYDTVKMEASRTHVAVTHLPVSWSMIDLTIPDRPRVVASPWLDEAIDLEFQGEYCYLVDGSELQIFLTTDMSNPLSRTSFPYCQGLAVNDSLVAVALPGGVTMVNVEDPRSPRLGNSLTIPWALDPKPIFDLDGDVLYTSVLDDPANSWYVRAYRVSTGTILGQVGRDGPTIYRAADGFLFDYEDSVTVLAVDEGGFRVVGGFDGGDGAATTRSVTIQDGLVYIAQDERVRILDATLPTDIVNRGEVEFPSSWLQCILVEEESAFVASKEDSIWKYDVSTPGYPRSEGGVMVGGDPWELGFIHYLGYDLLLVATEEGLKLVDDFWVNRVEETYYYGYRYTHLATIGTKVLAGHFNGIDVIDLSLGSPDAALVDSCPQDDIYDMAMAGNHLIFSIWDFGLYSAYVADPLNCSVDQFPIPGIGAPHIEIMGNHAFVSSQTSLHVFDVSDGEDLQRISITDTGFSGGIKVAGQYAFIWGYGEVRVIDVSDLLQPRVVANIPVPAPTREIAVVDNMIYWLGHDGVMIFEMALATDFDKGPEEVTQVVPQQLQVSVFGGQGTASGVIHYRFGGESGFTRSRPMLWNNESEVLTDVLPEDLFDIRGLEYYIEIQRGLHTARIGSPESPYSFVVQFDEGVGKRPSPLPNAQYQICTLPVDVSGIHDANVEAVLADDFGPYDATQWRIFSMEPAGNEFLEGGAARPVAPDQAYWLIARGAKVYDSPGRTVRPNYFDEQGNAFYRVPLSYDPVEGNGWNLLANPYPFAVEWAGVRFLVDGRLVDGHPASVLDDVAYRYGGSDYEVGVPGILAWEGVAVHVNRTDVVALVPYREWTVPEARGKAEDSASGDQRLAWHLDLSLVSGPWSDHANRIGVAVDAESGPDPFDALEPPSPPGAAVLYLRLPEGSERAWRTDVRPPGRGIEKWDLKMTGGSKRTLRVTGFGTLPADAEARLTWDGGHQRILRAGETVHLPDDLTAARLWVGGAEILDGEIGPPSPRKLELMNPYPNPFNGGTRIGFALPVSTELRLEIFDLRGRRLRTMVQGEMGAGIHSVEWDGRDGRGRSVAAGIYLCRMQAEGFSACRRLTLVR